ncbi:MAG: alpha-L-arabinofuranosidase [Phycisphaeraceae bacterium JB051]
MTRHAFFSMIMLLTLAASTTLAQTQPAGSITLIPLLDQTVDTRPNVLGQNMTGKDWHGVKGDIPVFFNPKLGKVDPAWMPLITAFDLHLLRLHWGNKYPWKNAVGPLDQRKSIEHEMWKAHYRTEAGLDEYLQFFQSIPNAPQLTLIASPLRPTQELADLVAYCNSTTGPMADMRKANGHAAPYNIRYWEMGNEIDYKKRADVDVMRQDTEQEKREKHSVDDYLQLIMPRIAAMKAVDPTIKIFVHAQTAPWYNHTPDWPKWHQTLLKQIGDQIDGIVIHPYYDGYSVSTCLKSVDQVIDDIAKFGPKDRDITVWVNEHARWVNYRKREERPQSWSLQGAISSADFLMRLMQRPGVGMANYWCFGHRGPWRVINANWEQGADQKFGTAIHGMFRIFNAALLPKATPIALTDAQFKSDHFAYEYPMTAMLFTDPDSKAMSLLVSNRVADSDFAANIKLPTLPNSQATFMQLTGESLRSTNVPQTPDANTVSQSTVTTPQDAAGNVQLTIPAKSVMMWQWK